MTECFVYDTVRTPRGKGKKDGALHEVTALELSTQTLKAIRDRNALDTRSSMTWCWAASIRSANRAATSPASPCSNADYAESRRRRTDQPLLRQRPGSLQHGGRADHVRTIRHDDRRRRRIDEPRRHGRHGGAWSIDPAVAIKTYFTPQGIGADLIATLYGFSRDDVDAYAVESQKRAAQCVEEGHFKKSVVPVKESSARPSSIATSTCAPMPPCSRSASLKPSFEQLGEFAGFDSVAMQRYPQVEKLNHVHHAGNSSRHRRRRGRGPARQRRRRARRWA